MRHLRLIVRHNPADPADDLKQVARLKRDLWSHSRVEVDPDNAFCRTQRDDDRNAYFEFATESPEQVRQVLQQHGHEGRVTRED